MDSEGSNIGHLEAYTPTMTFWFDGRIGNGPDASTTLSAGALLGWGVFTTLGIWEKKPFAVERHLERLRHDAARARVPFEYENSDLVDALQAALSASGIVDGIARLTATKQGDGRWNLGTGSDISIALNAVSSENRRAPVRLRLSSHRTEARRPLAGVKSTSYLDYQLSWLEASENGFDDALLCNSSGVLCECSRSNLFWARGGALFTPSEETGCLPGIGRALMIEWAGQQGIEVRQGAFSPHELQLAEEIFVTASTTGPRHVKHLQLGTDWDLQWDEAGPITQTLQQEWEAKTGAAGGDGEL